MFGDGRHLIFQRVSERHVTNIMKQRRETQDLHAFFSLWLRQREVALQSLRDSSGDLHHAEYMLKSRMLRRGVNKIRQTQLFASVKTLKSRGLNDAHFDLFLKHFRAALEEVGVKPENVEKIMKRLESKRGTVLDR